jgi:hypothetical protein
MWLPGEKGIVVLCNCSNAWSCKIMYNSRAVDEPCITMYNSSEAVDVHE